jgi:large subunit ribosomal protein L9
MIADAIEQQLGVEVDRKRVGKGQTIKTAGLHQVEVNIYREIGATVAVLVGKPVEAEVEPEPEVEEVAEVEETEEAAEAEE